ncbi:HD domain-containing phosphohydrolase [Aeromonas fluvialis]|uniref:HD domain-containing phosphohydrolase n=1 Tax=Aeromonas fluvialis TaxID=591962 RepID=UPI0005AB06B2|nr:HD domain-containing phosphohydrolase [Aeromonas fluvialis]
MNSRPITLFTEPTRVPPLSTFALFSQVMDQLPYRVLFKDTRSIFIACNRLLADDLALTPAELVGKCDVDFFPAELAQRYRDDDLQVMTSGTTRHHEEPYLKGGKNRWLSTTKFPLYDELGKVIGVGVFFDDITEKKQQQERLQQYIWTQEAITRAHHALLKQGDEQTLLQEICDAITFDGRFPLVTVLLQVAGQDGLQLVAQAGHALCVASDDWLSRDPDLIRAISTAMPCNETLPCELVHHSVTLRAHLLLPLPWHTGEKGGLLIHSEQARPFTDEEVHLFSQLADYLAYGLQARNTQQAYLTAQRDQVLHARQLEQALEDALGAIAAVLEQRDPYTAGHQKHVATLALAIGRELKLDDKRLRGLYLGAMVHDIGKIQIPVDILTKPGRLTPQEFNLVKEHPGAGYQVLKDIALPWPIARMIHQHHEYLDGSGYPQGLKGDEILLEARILTVADIVESMSSDRPYRAALGIPQARAHIIDLRGTKLDAEVVDACLRILHRGEFTPHELGHG